MADRTNYTHLDELLFEAIERAPRRFDSLRTEFEAEFDKHTPRDRWGNANGWRAIDRRLQALRKAGRIKADPKLGWIKASLSSSSGRETS